MKVGLSSRTRGRGTQPRRPGSTSAREDPLVGGGSGHAARTTHPSFERGRAAGSAAVVDDAAAPEPAALLGRGTAARYAGAGVARPVLVPVGLEDALATGGGGGASTATGAGSGARGRHRRCMRRRHGSRSSSPVVSRGGGVSQEPPASWAPRARRRPRASRTAAPARAAAASPGQRWPRGSSTASRRRRRPSSGAAAAEASASSEPRGGAKVAAAATATGAAAMTATSRGRATRTRRAPPRGFLVDGRRRRGGRLRASPPRPPRPRGRAGEGRGRRARRRRGPAGGRVHDAQGRWHATVVHRLVGARGRSPGRRRGATIRARPRHDAPFSRWRRTSRPRCRARRSSTWW